MKILSLTEKNKPFVYLCVGKAVENLPNLIDCESTVLDVQEWQPTYNPDIDLFICEAAYLGRDFKNVSINFLRGVYPKAKFVVLGSDTIYYTTMEVNNGYQIDYPQDCDLFLETMHDPECLYRRKGVTVDHWDWTISQWTIDYLEKFEPKPWNEREYDFISVLSPHTINREGSYRNRMVKSIEEAGLKFTQGGGSGMADNNYDTLFDRYCNSRATLGTSSHDNPAFFGRKGFRDAIAPFLGSVLIYDDFKDVVEDYLVGGIMPMYGYEKFEELPAILDYLNNNPTHRNFYIEKQKEFFDKNSIDNQLVEKLGNHGLI